MSQIAIDKIVCRWIIVDQWQLLVVKLKSDDEFWCLPWGNLDHMETIEHCIAREIFEELNITASVGPLAFISQALLTHLNKHLIEFFYVITNWSDYRHVDLADSSHGYEIADLKRIQLNDTATNLLPRWILTQLNWLSDKDIHQLSTQSIVSD